MADWDADSPQLRRNLASIAQAIGDSADRRDKPSRDLVREWHRQTMKGLAVPDPAYVGRFRGEPGAQVEVVIGAAEGVAYENVKAQLDEFERRMQAVVAAVDAEYPAGAGHRCRRGRRGIGRVGTRRMGPNPPVRQREWAYGEDVGQLPAAAIRAASGDAPAPPTPR
jgi:hypothetical protein